MSLAEAQRKSFEDRLGRIRVGASNTMGEVHIGPAEDRRANEGKPKNRVRIKSRKKQNVRLGEGSNSVLIPVAVLLGGLSMFVALAMQFHLFDPRGALQLGVPHPALEPYMQYAPFVFASVFALAVSSTFRLNTFLRRTVLIAGVMAGFVFHPQLVNTLPGVHVAAFSKEYVKTMRADLRAG